MFDEPNYKPGHYYRVLRGPFVGAVGQWACSLPHSTVGLIGPDLPPSGFGGHIAFRLDDLEDLTPEAEIPEAIKRAFGKGE